MRWPIGMLVVPLSALACGQGSGSGSGKDAGPNADTASLTLPDGLVPVGCPPDVGNELGIGKPCTATGTECTGNLSCLCKNWFGYAMPAGTPCFCTIVSLNNACTGGCGSNTSCCTYDIPLSSPITVSACFPAVCVSNNSCPVLF
jgi:hypothetical protein